MLPEVESDIANVEETRISASKGAGVELLVLGPPQLGGINVFPQQVLMACGVRIIYSGYYIGFPHARIQHKSKGVCDLAVGVGVRNDLDKFPADLFVKHGGRSGGYCVKKLRKTAEHPMGIREVPEGCEKL